MKLLHIADLHIGKRVNEFSMVEDQKFILDQLIGIVRDAAPDAVLIAGDVYDKSQPPTDAVELLDTFLTGLIALEKPVFLISGNHDSPERLGFLSRVTRQRGLYIAGAYNGDMQKITLGDAYGPLHIYLLPFIKPAMLRPHADIPPTSHGEAVAMALWRANIDPTCRNVLVAHQFVTSGAALPERSDSEAVSIGGLDNVDAAVFDAFDYVALGHLHGAQRIGRDGVRYAGSPLKYSFSEAYHNKSAVMVEMKEKGEVQTTLIPLHPLHDLRRIKGPLAALLDVGRLDPVCAQDYMHITLTDEDEIYDAIGRLRQVYPNLMTLAFERHAHDEMELPAPKGEAEQSPLALFADFYALQNGAALSAAQTDIMTAIFQNAGGDGL